MTGTNTTDNTDDVKDASALLDTGWIFNSDHEDRSENSLYPRANILTSMMFENLMFEYHDRTTSRYREYLFDLNKIKIANDGAYNNMFDTVSTLITAPIGVFAVYKVYKVSKNIKLARAVKQAKEQRRLASNKRSAEKLVGPPAPVSSTGFLSKSKAYIGAGAKAFAEMSKKLAKGVLKFVFQVFVSIALVLMFFQLLILFFAVKSVISMVRYIFIKKVLPLILYIYTMVFLMIKGFVKMSLNEGLTVEKTFEDNIEKPLKGGLITLSKLIIEVALFGALFVGLFNYFLLEIVSPVTIYLFDKGLNTLFEATVSLAIMITAIITTVIFKTSDELGIGTNEDAKALTKSVFK